MRFSIPRFWREKPGHYFLRGTRCKACGRINYPPSKICRYCGSRDTEEVDLLEPGRVVTWTVIYSAPEGFEEYKPIIIAMVELINSKARILTQLTDIDPSEIKEGMIVEPVLRRINEDGETGIIHYAIKFRPVIGGISDKQE